jgi:hypothetical protein
MQIKLQKHNSIAVYRFLTGFEPTIFCSVSIYATRASIKNIFQNYFRLDKMAKRTKVWIIFFTNCKVLSNLVTLVKD